MKSKEIRKKFIQFFKKNKHKFVAPVSLIPENDPTVLFTVAGMQQFSDYFLDIAKPPSKRIVNYQHCFRTIDLDKVGTNDRTLTFFEMLGSWSIGDYWKAGAIELAWELLTSEFGFPSRKLWVTVFKGNKEIPQDTESIKCWKKVGLPNEKIIKLGENDNFWIAGETGPCGPSTEVYFDQGKNIGCGKKNCKPGCDCDRFLEIWNAGVFIEYDRKLLTKNEKLNNKYEYIPLKIKSVDTGAGLERLAAVLQDKDSVFEIDLFKPILNFIYKNIPSRMGKNPRVYKSLRIITDHIRSSVFLVADGVVPSNKTQGYVLRRLLRRMILHGWLISLKKDFVPDLAKIVIKTMDGFYPHLRKQKKNIIKVLTEEESNFTKTLKRGMKKLNLVLAINKKTIPGKDAFMLYDSFGFPLELTVELAHKKKIKVDEKGFEKEMTKQQKRSRTAAKGFFKGGLAGMGEKETRLHTATHLLHETLRKVLGSHVEQKGSNINPERLRFDFSHPEKLTDGKINKIEDLVNKKIDENLPVSFIETTVDEAKKLGARAQFSTKYGQKVKLYYIGNNPKSAYSKELCGGPHIKNTNELGKFKIISEKSSSSGIRRIKAVLE